jgi:hypothetical protein
MFRTVTTVPNRFDVLWEDLPFDRDVALALTSAFGGGLGSSGNLCGAVAGGVMAIV